MTNTIDEILNAIKVECYDGYVLLKRVPLSDEDKKKAKAALIKYISEEIIGEDEYVTLGQLQGNPQYASERDRLRAEQRRKLQGDK